MNEILIYNAGPMFSDIEINERKRQGEKFEEYNLTFYNPVEYLIDEFTPMEAIAEMDYNFISKTTVMFVDLTNNDPGTLVEYGMALKAGIRIFAYNSDFRHPYNNAFVYGMLPVTNNSLYESFDEAFDEFIRQYDIKKTPNRRTE